MAGRVEIQATNQEQFRVLASNLYIWDIQLGTRLDATILRRVIDSDEKLAAWIPVVRAADWIAVDTEADSLHAYPEKVCLIQISTSAGDRLVDPLSGINLNPLLDALGGHCLIMHGADYDLRLLQKHHAFIPKSIFDTMLAARLLGLRHFGYSHIVEQYLGVKLEKGPQKANWARRPLTERMETYARNDTHHLRRLSMKITAELTEKQRLSWHQESCARLILECTRPQPVDEDAWRLKGSHTLSRAGMAILRELWRWRESEAVAANRPPFFILSHEALVNIADAAASHRPVDPVVPRFLSPSRRARLGEAVKTGLQIPPDRHPRPPERGGRRPSEPERRRYHELQKRRDSRADALAIDPTLIASRFVLGELARNWDENIGSLMNWQRDLMSP